MFSISQNIISIHRGNYGSFRITIAYKDGPEYKLKPGDKIVFSLRKNVNSKLLLTKEFVTNLMTIDPEDTNMLPFGEYKYDIWLVPEDGKDLTIVDATTFNILEVVR